MIRAVGNKRLSLTDVEHDAYLKIIESVDKSDFNGAFESDNNGMILCVLGKPSIDPIITHYLFNIMHNQRIRDHYKIFKSLESRINKLENEIKEIKK